MAASDFVLLSMLRKPGSPYRGVATVCGVLPGAISVLVPLPLLISSPCPVLPGIVVVSSDPMWPVMKAGPLDVRTGRSSVGPCTLGNGEAPDSDADTTSKAERRPRRTLRASTIAISFFALPAAICRHAHPYRATLR